MVKLNVNGKPASLDVSDDADFGANQVDRGGHFAAWEEPKRFAAELRAAFKSLR